MGSFADTKSDARWAIPALLSVLVKHQELKKSAAKQAKVLSNLSKVVDDMSTKQRLMPTIEPVSRITKPRPPVEEPPVVRRKAKARMGYTAKQRRLAGIIGKA